MSWIVAIPTLKRYDLLVRLASVLLGDCGDDSILSRIIVLDNGGKLLQSDAYRALAALPWSERIEIVTPKFNFGVAGSWNYFARNYGRCIISNDDVVFKKPVLEAFAGASSSHPESVILENSDPVAGFSTFLLNRPEEWLEMGGFDECLNPAYFEDNDCRRRLSLVNNPVVKVPLVDWYHDNSSTLAASDDDYKRMHWCLYRRNQVYYQLKWGGLPGSEKYLTPFGKSD
jgi:GT2 family glycosyltransferase